MRKLTLTVVMMAALVLMITLPSAWLAASAEEQQSAIVSVTALGFLDYDGPKMNGVAIEYGVELTADAVHSDQFAVAVKRLSGYAWLGDGTPGDVTAVYVNDTPALSTDGGSGAGRYVILELFTDYQARAMLSFNSSLSVSVTQVADISLQDGTVLPASEVAVSNSFGEKDKGRSFLIPDIAGFRWYTDSPGYYGADGPAYYRADCFSMLDGLTHDVHLAYALCLPEDYHEDGTYALVTVQNPAATAGTHPLAAVLASRTPAVYASQWPQQAPIPWQPC